MESNHKLMQSRYAKEYVIYLVQKQKKDFQSHVKRRKTQSAIHGGKLFCKLRLNNV